MEELKNIITMACMIWFGSMIVVSLIVGAWYAIEKRRGSRSSEKLYVSHSRLRPVSEVPAGYGVCKICGCTDDNACYHPDCGPCCWADDNHDICSHCMLFKPEEVERINPYKRIANLKKLKV